MAETQPLLDLSSSSSRPVIRIDGVDYKLRTSNDLTLRQHQQIEQTWPRIAALLQAMDQRALSKKDAAELRTLLLSTCQLAMLAPPAVIERQGDLNLTLIFDAFLKLLLPSLRTARARLLGATSVPQAGAKPFPGSPASTAARPTSGRRKSR